MRRATWRAAVPHPFTAANNQTTDSRSFRRGITFSLAPNHETERENREETEKEHELAERVARELDAVFAADRATLENDLINEDNADAGKLRRRIAKAGYDLDMDTLVRVDSLVVEHSVCFFNKDDMLLKRRRKMRERGVQLPTVTGRYTANMYCIEANEKIKRGLQSRGSLKNDDGQGDFCRRPMFFVKFESGDERNYPMDTADSVLRPQTSNGGRLQVNTQVVHTKLGPGEIQKITEQHHRASRLNRRVGFTKEFQDLVIGISYFTVDSIARLAANDFVRNPTLMIIVYMEWSSAAETLAKSGQLSQGASNGVLQLAETLALAPAGCLDYFDSECLKEFGDNSHAGFTLSGHILKNMSILDPSGSEYHELPPTITASHAPILAAIRNNHKGFLSQMMVYLFLCDNWKGGGWNSYSFSQKLWYSAGLLCFSWLIVTVHFILLMLFAICPPLSRFYASRFAFHKSSTMMRLVFGLVFNPLFRWSVNELLDLSVVLLFSEMPMMPFHQEWDFGELIREGRPEERRLHFGSAPPGGIYRVAFVYLWVVCVGSLVLELGQLRDTVFAGLDVEELWRHTGTTIVNTVLDFVNTTVVAAMAKIGSVRNLHVTSVATHGATQQEIKTAAGVRRLDAHSSLMNVVRVCSQVCLSYICACCI